MLDKFLEVSYAHEQSRNMRNEMAEAMTALPNEMLHKLASGEEKLAFGDEGGCWLDQFAGTPLYEQAIQLEEQSIRLKAERQSQQHAERTVRDQIYDAEDAIRLKKKMLELDMRKQEAGASGEAPSELAEEAAETEPEPESDEAMKEGSALRAVLVGSMRKEAIHPALAAGGVGTGFGAGVGLGIKYLRDKGDPRFAPERQNSGLGELIARHPVLSGAAAGGLGGIAGGFGGERIAKNLPGGMGLAMLPAAAITAGHLTTLKKPGEKSKKSKKGKEKKSSVDPYLIASMRKNAAVLTTNAREKIKSKNFAIPKKGKGEGSYPINDPKHARNALTRVRQFGSPAEKAKVYKAVTKKYPALATRSEVIPPKQQHKAEKKLRLGKGEESQKKEKALQKVSSINPYIIAEMRMSKAAAKLPPALKAAKIPKGTDLDEDGKTGEGKGKPAFMKQSAMEVADQWGRRMAELEKDALSLGSVVSPLKALGKGAVKAVKGGMATGISPLAAKAGMTAAGPGLGAAAKNMGALGMQWAKKNPLHAAGLAGAAGLGAGAALT